MFLKKMSFDCSASKTTDHQREYGKLNEKQKYILQNLKP